MILPRVNHGLHRTVLLLLFLWLSPAPGFAENRATPAVISDEGGSYQFDEHELRRFAVSAALLPEGSDVRFRPSSSYQVDKWTLFCALTAIVLLAGTTALLVFNIIRRRRSERALSAGRDLLASFCDALPDLAFVVDEDGVFVEVLSARTELAYIDPGETKGRSLSDIFPPFIAGLFQSKVDAALAAGELTVFEYPLTVPAGECFFEARLLPMPVSQGSKRMVVWIARDVTERRANEDALEERVRLAALEATIGHALVEGETLSRTLDQCCCALIDFSEAVFGRIWTLNPADNVLELKASVGLYTHVDGSHARIPVGQGKVGHIAATGRPCLTNDLDNDPLISDHDWARKQGLVAHTGFPLLFKGRLVGAVVLFFRQKVSDATFDVLNSVTNKLAIGVARFNAEEELQQTLKEATESRERLDTILLSVADGLIVTDTGNHIVMMNRAAERLTGTVAGEVIGQSIEKTLSDVKLLGGLTSVLLGEKPFETLVVDMADREHGGVCAVEARIAPVWRKSGRCSGSVTILRDVTREREIDRMKSEFISIAAHELRTPLTTVLGYAELLLNEVEMGGFDAEKRREFLGYIYEKSEVLRHIIDDTLDLGRIESGRPMLLHKSTCEMAQLVGSSVAPLRQENPRHLFVTDCPATRVLLDIDQQKIMQVLDNLLNNAVKYSPEGGKITVSGRKSDDEELCITISDEGIGMAPEQMKRAFDKFYRADSGDTAVGGLGLGMSICKNIIEAHGGTIWVDSVLGGGTTVGFSLPIR